MRPDGMSVEEWQRTLRRQYGTSQPFVLKRVGKEKVFSDFLVTNPASRRTWRVAIRGEEPGVSFCSCPDFATNLLGTCKHVEFVLAALRRRRGAARLLREGFRPAWSSVSLVHGSRRRLRLRLADGAPRGLRKVAVSLVDPDGFIRDEAYGRLEALERAARRAGHELRVYDDAAQFARTVLEGEERRRRLDMAFPAGAASPAFDGLLKTPLPGYQREGALFACRAGRAILADEMGLGKTVQAIAAAEIAARWLGVERVLVVCPASLKHQWQDEVERFSTRPVAVVGGGRKAREAAWSAPGFLKVTGYDAIHRDLDAIARWAPQLVVLDEAQRIKNWATRVAVAVKRIESPLALVLTGTPLENRLEELISIVQFVDQHRLGPTWRVLHDHQVVDEGSTRVVGYRDLDRLGESLAPVLLRRRKSEVLAQLPERSVKRLFLPLTEAQRELHEENAEAVAKLVAKWRRHRFLSDADQKRLRIALQAMRMACDDAYLLDGKTRSGRKAAEVDALLGDLLASEGTKVVVFSQWVRMHELLIERLEAAGRGFAFLHGGVPSGDRGALVRRFRTDPHCRVFLSTDAGGTGLNLQAASAVVNVDLPWNPAVLEQRIGRVHRLGQSRPVQVFDLVAEDSIEQRMLGLLGFKRALFAGVLDGGEKEVRLGGSRLARFLEAVGEVAEPLPGGDPGNERPGKPAPSSEDAAGEASAGGATGASPVPLPAAAPTALPPRADVASLLRAGATLLGQLAAAAEAASSGAPGGGLQIENDPATGRSVLRLELADAEAFLGALASLAGGRTA
ncbi:MAG TPA: DEAD/DEAH box helicase [Thermoanaerobaculia bacterium]|nr:DEAD/DEAH box helicase [Thermoanaerobaculia bacterium]